MAQKMKQVISDETVCCHNVTVLLAKRSSEVSDDTLNFSH